MHEDSTKFRSDTRSILEQCSIAWCANQRKYRQNDLCSTHYTQVKRHGTVFPLDIECPTCQKEFGRGRAKKFCSAKCMKRFHQIKNHGLTVEIIREMLKLQSYQCGLDDCNTEISIFSAHIDHDHKHCSGSFGRKDCFRGILCLHCNHLLGCAFDKISRLRSAIEYLGKN
jgi:hypothetical protein